MNIVPDNRTPIVVDLDGTLIHGNLLFECANQFISKSPLNAFRMTFWLLKGKYHLKKQLASNTDIDVSNLPYNEILLAWLLSEKQAGRQIILATASYISLANKVAKHLGIFNDVFASEAGINLKSTNKAEKLVKAFGVKGFEYVGNDNADIPVWKLSQKSHIAVNCQSLNKKLSDIGNMGFKLFEEKPSIFRSFLKALRPYQWLKNCLIFIPLLTAHRFTNMDSVVAATMAFVGFCLTASSAYVLNDLLDISNDRKHLTKHKRPFAAGNLSIATGWATWPLLFISAFMLSTYALPTKFVGALLAYFIFTLLYSFSLKRIAILDVTVLAGLYTLRIIAGCFAIGVPASFWLLAFSMFLFLSLANIKRYSEILDHTDTSNIPGRGYAKADLPFVGMLGICAGQVAVLIMALFINEQASTALYENHKILWFSCPPLLLWVSRTWLLTYRGQMHSDPIIFSIKDMPSWILGILTILPFIAASIL